jgi:amino acid transporter
VPEPTIATTAETAVVLAPPRRRMHLLPLVAATYFMVSGGPYGLEDIVGQAGYARALALLLLVPVVWSLPTALMVGELASALPEQGGFYIWVRRALGPFWGAQEAWLSLASSVFDMAIYPALFTAYVGQLHPAWTSGARGPLLSVALVLLCLAWNLRGACAVGRGSAGLFALLLVPFVGMGGFAIARIAEHLRGTTIHGAMYGTMQNMHARKQAPIHGSLTAALLLTLWNYMGWDNASTIAHEVVEPQRNYMRGMLAAVAVVTLSYVVPVAMVACSGIPASTFTTGAWVQAARLLAGAHWGATLAALMMLGGALTAIAMFNALALSYAHLPAAMASDGLLPAVFARRTRTGAPWVALLACGSAWLLALGLSLVRLLELDVLLYGLSLILEFVALAVLRQRQPNLPRPFRIPGGTLATVLLGLCPTLLIGFAVYAARADRITPHLSALALGTAVILLGPLLYWTRRQPQQMQ